MRVALLQSLGLGESLRPWLLWACTLEWCFWILLLTPEYSLEIQARIPAVLCAIHNFIGIHDPIDETIYTDDNDSNNSVVFDDNTTEAIAAEADTPSARRDHIAQQMWDDYLAIRMERAIDNNDHDEDSEDSSDEDWYYFSCRSHHFLQKILLYYVYNI